MGKVKIELDDDTAKVLGSIIDEVIKTLQNEKKERQEAVKILNELVFMLEKLEKKSKIFFENEEICTNRNLWKLYNLYKQQEEFFDSVISKNNK